MYKIRDIDLSADSPECKTAKEIIEAVLSYHYKVFPDLNLKKEMNKLIKTGMNESQLAYSIAKTEYEITYEEAKKKTDNECKEIGLNIKRGMSDEDLDKWNDIIVKHEHNYAVGHFMYFKWRSEETMVNTAFQLIESNPATKKLIASDDAQYNKIKNEWKKYPSISKQVINLAFRLRV